MRLQPAQSLIELLIVVGVAAIILPSVFSGLIAGSSGIAQAQKRNQANLWLQETLEAVRSVRNRGWTAIATNGTFHPVIVGGIWTLAAGSDTQGDLTRSVLVSDYMRNLVADPSTKQITTTISWSIPWLGNVQHTNLLTRYMDNLLWKQTSQADFDAGTKSGTTITNTNGGEVVLAAGGQGNWCAPNLSISALDLPKSGVANALTAIEGRAFAGTGDNASGVSFANVNINNANPPVPNIAGTFDGYKTNDIFGESNYAYLATDNNTKEIIIIDLTTNPYSESGYFNAPGSGNGNSVYVSGNTGYMVSGNKLYIFDLSSKTGSRPALGNVTLAGTGRALMIVGNFVYVAIDSSGAQLQIVDVANPASPGIIGQADVGDIGAVDVYVNSTGTRSYLAAGNLYVIDTSSKTGNRPSLSSYNPSGMSPKGLVAVSGNKIILVGSGGEEYQAIDVTTEATPLRCGGLNIDAGINGVATVVESDNDAYAYIITGDSSSEFKIIAGGPGGGLASEGIFESSEFNAGFQSAVNRLEFDVIKPVGTDVKLQVAVGCGNTTYVGPDGTSASFYTTAGAIAVGQNTGQCVRYKAYLSTASSTASPILEEVRLNYSP